MLNKVYTYLRTPETSGRTIGLFRVLFSVFGGLLIAYLGMTLLAFVLPLRIEEAAILSIMFNTFAWAIATTWIALSFTKLQTLLRFLIPLIIIAVLLYLFV